MFIEIDEKQRKEENYTISCDVSRMSKIYETLIVEGNMIPIKFIRYNPHEYKINNKTIRTSCIDRHNQLIHEIQETVFSKSFSVKYLFYDMKNNEPAIFRDIDYNESFKQFVEL